MERGEGAAKKLYFKKTIFYMLSKLAAFIHFLSFIRIRRDSSSHLSVLAEVILRIYPCSQR